MHDQSDTPPKLLRQRSREWADRPALAAKRRGLWSGLSWAQYYRQVRAVALGLRAAGLQRGDRVSVLAENRPEWLFVDLGVQCLGGVGNGIYPTSSPEQVAHVLADSGSAYVVVENQEQLDKVLAVRGRCPALRRVWVLEREGLRGFADPGVGFFDDLQAEGAARAATEAADFDAAIDATRPEDLAFLVYTSGTTGAPKGAMIRHGNVMAQLAIVDAWLGCAPGDRALSFLPLCHIAERMASVFNPLAAGLVVHFPENAGTVFNDLREVEPQVVFAPPRFWEKLHAQVELGLRDAIAPARWVWARAQRPGAAAWQRALAHTNVRRFLGLARLKTALTGAAPVPPELVRWYQAMGIELREAFGMTETCGFVTATLPGQVRVGWAGRPGPGIAIRLGAEAELLVKGGNVFAGYWGRSESPVDADGWLHTGDCAEIAESGELAIRDRLKDILITSGGKNITPSQIENGLKFSPYITDAVAVGDGRRYVTALVMLDHEQVARFARDEQVPYTDHASLARAPQVVALIRAEVERANAQLARVEQVKDFRIIEQLLTADDEELTPTMKLKRRLVTRKYAALIDSMYPD